MSFLTLILGLILGAIFNRPINKLIAFAIYKIRGGKIEKGNDE
jgi:hypothetical protein